MQGQGPETFFQLATRILPVSYAYQTQIAPGRLTVATHMFRAGDVAMVRVQLSSDTLSSILPVREFVAVVLPLHGEHWVNGVHLTPPRMYMSADGNGYFARGGPRDVITLGLKRSRLIETLAALEGCTPEEVALENRVIEIPLRSFYTLRRKCAALVELCATAKTPDTVPATFEIEESLFGALIDAYLAAPPPNPGASGRRSDVNPARVVRLAEDYFEEMQGQRTSLADLCAASSVGRNVLYSSFRQILDETPLGYFHKRRLHWARTELLEAANARGAVKRIALELGLTELGRFAVEYRSLFGESPSATLHQSSGKRANEIYQAGTFVRASNITTAD